MRLVGANLLPFAPATYIWEVTPTQQTGFYTTFFWGNDDGTAFDAAETYAGFHPYPQGSPGSAGTVHNWEISANGVDRILDENSHDTTVTKGVKYLQAATVQVVSTNYVIKFYWDLSDTTKLIQLTFATANYIASPSPALFVGGNAWASTTENLSGDFQRFKSFTAILTLSDISSEGADMTRLVTAAGTSNIWFGKTTYTSNTDLTCNYGTGRVLAWADTNNKATLVSA